MKKKLSLLLSFLAPFVAQSATKEFIITVKEKPYFMATINTADEAAEDIMLSSESILNLDNETQINELIQKLESEFGNDVKVQKIPMTDFHHATQDTDRQ